jgi:hypothetical protein
MTNIDTRLPRILTLDEVLTFPGVPADHRFHYGPDPAQFGDLYLPQQPGPHPAVILLHGGCWQAQHSLTMVGQLAEALRQAGLAVWSLEYRRLGNGGGWPTTFLDVAMGADFLRTLAPRFLIPDAGHFEVIFPFTAAWPAVRHAVLAFANGTPAAQRGTGQPLPVSAA